MAGGERGGEGWLEVDRFRSRPDRTSEFVRARIPSMPIPPEQGGGAASRQSAPFISAGVKFLRASASSFPPHPAPQPQIVVVLSGRIEVTTTGDRLTRSWGAGEMFIASDHDGIGHHTRIDEGTRLIFLPLGDVDLDAWTVA
jgi:hypothetical protein